MKVGLLIYGSLDTLSGGYLYDRRLVEHLRACGHSVEIFSLPWRNYALHLTDNFNAGFLKRLENARLDVLIQDELNHPSLFWLNRRLRPKVSYKLVSIVHHLRCSELRPAWQNTFYRQIERLYLQTLDGFVFNSRTTQGVVESLVAPRPSVIGYPGGDRLGITLDPDTIQARALEPGPLRLLFFGNLIPRKGMPTLLEALARLKEGDWRLDVVGSLTSDPEHAAEVQAQASALGLQDRVTFHGAVFDDDLVPHLKAAHALVLPSSYEGFGIVYMEAAAFGLPSIASQTGAAGEIVAHGQSGYLIQPGQSHALAAHLKHWMTHRHELAAMGQAARRRFDQHPTWEASAETIRQYLLHMTTQCPT